MMKILSLLLILPLKIVAQLPDTDIFLCSLLTNPPYNFSNPVNITDRPGYDNQPAFSPDGKSMLYVSITDSLQSDIYQYNLQAGAGRQFTDTRESEYSPAYVPGGNFISAVRVDADSGQRFYKIPLSNRSTAQHISNTDSIGYYCWINDHTLAMFILGRSHTLQVLDLKSGERRLIASDIGRCMKLSPDASKMYFVLKSNPAEWYIYAMDAENFSLERIAATMEGSEDFAILPDGKIIMGQKAKLFLLGESKSWSMIADFSAQMNDFYRITVSADGSRIALVAFTGKKP